MLRIRLPITVGLSQAIAMAIAVVSALVVAGGVPHLSLGGLSVEPLRLAP